MSVRLYRSFFVFILLFCLIIFLFSIIFDYSLQLKGEKNVYVALNNEYQENGAVIKFGNKKNKIDIIGKVDNTKVGKYKIEYKTNIYGIDVSTYRIVEVIDEEAPVIELVGDEKVSVCQNEEYQEEGYKAIDSYDGDVTEKVKVKRQDDSILYSVKDNSNNQATIIRYINHEDNESPKIKLKGNSMTNVILGNEFNDPGYEVSDNCTDKVTVSVSGKVDTDKVGTYELVYTASDDSGNESSVKRYVKVSKKDNRVGIIYLTFDDGPSSTSTPKILSILKKKKVKATFFVINHSSKLDKLIKQEYDEGHTVALHSYSHNYKTVYSSKKAFYEDLDKIQNKVQNIIGEKVMITRFPGGSSNTISKRYQKGIMTELTEEMKEKGYHYFDWNVGSGDAGGVKTSNGVYNNVIKGLSKNRVNVVLMHDFENNNKTVDALERIIDYGLANGYIFDKIDMTTNMVTHRVNN